MVPVGTVLLAVAAAGGARWVRLHRSLDEQVEGARLALARRLRNLPPPSRPAPPPRAVPAGKRSAHLGPTTRLTYTARLAALWISLTVTIGSVYLVQENVEAAAAAFPLPGLAPISGIHGAAPLVIAATAFLLAACAAEGRRRTAEATEDVEAVERLLRALLVLQRALAPAPAEHATGVGRHLERLGAQLWKRPPPGLAPAR
jgi:hypothetical protein